MKIRAGMAVAALIYAGSLFGTFQSLAARESIVLRAAAAIDVERGRALENVVVLVEGELIAAIGVDVAIPPNARVLDLGDVTLLPGLIDAHTHLLDNRDGTIEGRSALLLSVAQASTAKRALMGAYLAREVLEAGFTTVRDLGNSGVGGDVALRDAILAGWVPGPRIVASTRALAPVGGQFGPLPAETQSLIAQEYVVITGEHEARRAVRQAIYDGADCIKIIVNSRERLLSVDEVSAVVDEAHRLQRKVAAHATTDAATRIAAEAGVDSIEHAYDISDDVLRIMATKNIVLVPTDLPLDVYMDFNYAGRRLTAEERREIESQFEPGIARARDRIARAIRAGVRIGAGSDMFFTLLGQTRGQASHSMFRSYMESGMKPIEIIRAATVNNAELLGRMDQIGTIEIGKSADIIAVAGEPLVDPTALQRIEFVMKAGRIMRNERASK